MPVFGIKMKKRRASSLGSYHNDVEYANKHIRRKSSKEAMGIGRAILSGLSLSFGGMMCYVSLHYFPAYVQTHKILSSPSIDTSAARLKNKGPIRKVIGPYIDMFSMQRTYLRSGQEIQAQFVLPEGAKLELEIQQCRRKVIFEIFQCDVISRKDSIVTNETNGAASFQFRDNGFYHFNHKVTFAKETPANHQVVWVRL